LASLDKAQYNSSPINGAAQIERLLLESINLTCSTKMAS
jgi:hypothetical protein